MSITQTIPPPIPTPAERRRTADEIIAAKLAKKRNHPGRVLTPWDHLTPAEACQAILMLWRERRYKPLFGKGPYHRGDEFED